MATQDDYIRTALRVPPELHAQLHEAAKANNRTFNSEIVARLERSFAWHATEGQDTLAELREALDRLRARVDAAADRAKHSGS